MSCVNWEDYKGQVNSVKYMRNCINNNTFPKALLVTGPPGVGKSLLAELTIRSVICSNSIKPCGKCEYCSTNIKELSNVRWNQITNVTGMTDYLTETGLWAKEAPIILNDIGITRKFVVLDEIQLLNTNYIQSLLGYIDSSPKTTTWILISMDLSRFTPTDLEALSSRCTSISLYSHTVDNCIEYIINKWSYNEVDAKLLAELSDGNMRQIGTLINYCKGVDSSKSISEVLIGGASNRKDFWSYLYNKDYKNAMYVCDLWLRNTNSQVIIKLLINDLIEILSKKPTQDIIHDLDLLIKYSSNNIKVSLTNYITLLLGFKQEQLVCESVTTNNIKQVKDLSTFYSIKALEDYFLEYCIY